MISTSRGVRASGASYRVRSSTVSLLYHCGAIYRAMPDLQTDPDASEIIVVVVAASAVAIERF